MITVKSERPIFDMPFAEVLEVDTIQNLREGFGMMGMRFTGKPNKAAIKREERELSQFQDTTFYEYDTTPDKICIRIQFPLCN